MPSLALEKVFAGEPVARLNPISNGVFARWIVACTADIATEEAKLLEMNLDIFRAHTLVSLSIIWGIPGDVNTQLLSVAAARRAGNVEAATKMGVSPKVHEVFNGKTLALDFPELVSAMSSTLQEVAGMGAAQLDELQEGRWPLPLV